LHPQVPSDLQQRVVRRQKLLHLLALHLQAPDWQVSTPEHVVVHPPQWLLSVCSFTQAPLHRL
jgi:hypothetical protein